MARRLPIFLLLAILGCRIPNDREDLKLLDENKIRLNYPDLYLRARSQSNLALEAFYADHWGDLEQAAKSLEQTAGLLPKSAGAPSEPQITEQLRADAVKLAEASKAKDVRVSNETLQRIQFNIRSLRPMVKDGASDGKAPNE